jgi:hypothetical protein
MCAPVPLQANMLGDPVTAPLWMIADNAPQPINLRGIDFPSLAYQCSIHKEYYASKGISKSSKK